MASAQPEWADGADPEPEWAGGADPSSGAANDPGPEAVNSAVPGSLPDWNEEFARTVEGYAYDPSTHPPRHPPERWWGNHLGELRWQLELGRLMVDPVFYGVGVPRGGSAPVLAIPGFLAGDSSLSVMRAWLWRIGYRAHSSGIWANLDCSDRAVNALERRLETVAGETGRRVVLIGHSRGAHFAKALAVRRPELVCSVISLGSGLDTPFDISIPTQAAVSLARGWFSLTNERFARNGCFTAECRCAFARDYGSAWPEEVPLTSIYSKGDGVVRWRACVVPYARCVEVGGSHVGLAFNRKVYREIADTLARDTDTSIRDQSVGPLAPGAGPVSAAATPT